MQKKFERASGGICSDGGCAFGYSLVVRLHPLKMGASFIRQMEAQSGGRRMTNSCRTSHQMVPVRLHYIRDIIIFFFRG